MPSVTLYDCGNVELRDDEQVTVTNETGTSGYDVVRKSFGFFATPSLNHHLVQSGFRSALVECNGRLYIVIIDNMAEWERYRDEHGYRVIRWLSE